ncbi:hypothetical protein [Saccharopolyspora spinosa]|uniref:hypothetical protein n=1 Tax=Saccharopolyspora spinosa TaxID=60894 RepID=UPI0016597CC0|nr:hypothetical protein [Saccharopolyspora spinosa]
MRAQTEGGATTAKEGLNWLHAQGRGVENKAWWAAWRGVVEAGVAHLGVAGGGHSGGSRPARPGREGSGGAEGSVGLGEMRAGPSDDPVGREVLDDWSADFADDEDPFVWERGVGEGDVAGVLGLSPVDWGSFAESEGRSEVEVARLQLAAAQWVSPLLFAPVFVGAKPPERMAFDLVVDQVAVTLHRASRDGLSELEAGAAAQARAEELAARVREAGLEGAPDVRRTARPPVRGVGGVSSSVGGVGQRGLMGGGSSGWGSGEVYTGESQAGPSTLQPAAHPASGGDGAVASRQQDPDTGQKKARRRRIPLEELGGWVVRAQTEGEATTAEAGRKWLHAQNRGVGVEAWGEAWRAASGKEKRVQRRGIPREELGGWVVRAQNEGGATTATEGMNWLHAQNRGVDPNAWGEAWHAASGTEKRVQRRGIPREELGGWVVRAQNEGGATTATEGMNWLHAQGRGVERAAWAAAWHAASGTGERVHRPGIPREELGGWVLRAQNEGRATTATEGRNWLHAQGIGVENPAWREAWRGVEEAGVAHLGMTGGGHSGGSRPARPGSEGSGGAEDSVGLGEMRAGPSDDPVGHGVLGDWSADFADDEDPFVWERGVGEGDVAGVLGLSPVDWGSFAESEGRSDVEVARLQLAAAQWVSPLLFAPVFVGVKPPERVAFDLVVDHVAVTLHRASRDGLSEQEANAAAWTRAEELVARVREAGLEGAPDVRRTARPPVHGVEGVPSSVGGVGQRGLTVDEASEWGAGEVYPGESQAGPSTLQPAAHPASGGDGAVASGQQDPDTGQEKQARRRGISLGELGGWVVRAQNEGGATTAEAGMNWLRAQNRGVERAAWREAWRAASGKEKRARRPGIPRGELGGWVVRAQNEGGATTAEAGMNWLRAQNRGVDKNAWREAWRAASGKEKRARRSGIPRGELGGWVVRAQNEGGATTAEAGMNWLRAQNRGVDVNVWHEAWRAASGKEKRARWPWIPRGELGGWVVRAQNEGGATTAEEGLNWLHAQGRGVGDKAWWAAWRGVVEAGVAHLEVTGGGHSGGSRPALPGSEGFVGAEDSVGLGEMWAGPSDDPVGRRVLDDWPADFEDDEDPFASG